MHCTPTPPSGGPLLDIIKFLAIVGLLTIFLQRRSPRRLSPGSGLYHINPTARHSGGNAAGAPPALLSVSFCLRRDYSAMA